MPTTTATTGKDAAEAVEAGSACETEAESATDAEVLEEVSVVDSLSEAVLSATSEATEEVWLSETVEEAFC